MLPIACPFFELRQRGLELLRVGMPPCQQAILP